MKRTEDGEQTIQRSETLMISVVEQKSVRAVMKNGTELWTGYTQNRGEEKSMRLIDADALRDALGITGTADSCKGCKYNDRFEFACNTDAAPTFEYVCEMIDDAPTIEERKAGKWIDTDTVWTAIIGDNGFNIPAKMCSECKKPIAQIMWNNFCPSCGADMREQP